MGGRVKTLHPKIHGGLLGKRDDPEHVAQMQAHDIPPIDLLCLNLYPVPRDDCEAGLHPGRRRRADRHRRAGDAALGGEKPPGRDPADRCGRLSRVPAPLGSRTSWTLDYRRGLAAKAFAHTVAVRLRDYQLLRGGGGRRRRFPGDTGRLRAEKVQELRYGENPHQRGVLYRTPGAEEGLASAEQLNGKALSYINLFDAAGAYATVAEFDEPAAVVVKHANPCGAAIDSRHWRPPSSGRGRGTPISAFGSILAFNGEVDRGPGGGHCRQGIRRGRGRAGLCRTRPWKSLRPSPRWGKNVRLLRCPLPKAGGLNLRTIPGGFLAMDEDGKRTDNADIKVVTQRAPTDAETRDSDLRAAHLQTRKEQRHRISEGWNASRRRCRPDEPRRCGPPRRHQSRGSRSRARSSLPTRFLPFNDALEVTLDAGVMRRRPAGRQQERRQLHRVRQRARISRWCSRERDTSCTNTETRQHRTPVVGADGDTRIPSRPRGQLCWTTQTWTLERIADLELLLGHHFRDTWALSKTPFPTRRSRRRTGPATNASSSWATRCSASWSRRRSTGVSPTTRER